MSSPRTGPRQRSVSPRRSVERSQCSVSLSPRVLIVVMAEALAGHTDRAEQSGHIDRADRIEHTDRVGCTDRAERTDQVEYTDQVEHTDRAERTDRADWVEQAR